MTPLPKGHLPRLPAEFYRGRAFIHWTFTIEDRATGWLSEGFHHRWELGLLHTCARYSLAAAVYVLMPDHIHMLWLGLDDAGSDQRIAIEFIRKHVQPFLAPSKWQPQAFDHVLLEDERERGAFQLVAQYIMENPQRAGLASPWTNYPYVGGCIPGYPTISVRAPDYWDRFWRIYNRLVEQSTE